MKDEARPDARTTRVVFCGAGAFVAAFLALAWGIGANGVAATYSDPIAKIRAQDESIYASSAIQMAWHDDWMTPKFMGRIFLRKPPVLFWLSASAIRMLGLSLFAVRLPCLILGAAGVAAVLAWSAVARSMAAGAVAAGLMLISSIWQTFSRVCYTDAPACSFSALALAAVAFDPRMDLRRTRIAFGIFAGAAVLTKSAAGLLPLAAFALYCLLLAAKERPSIASILETAIVFTAVAAPWHIYQLLTHRQWFWADYIQWQLLGIGLHAESNGVFNRSPLFYMIRLIEMDPLLALFGVIGVIGVVRERRLRHSPAKLLAVAWLAVSVLALVAFQAKNLPYLVSALPPLAILGALGSPAILDRHPRIAIALVAAVFIAKGAAPGEPWGLRPAAPPLEGAAAMRAYCNLHRDAELIAVDTNDEFYSATLPLKRVRYCFLDPSNSVAASVPYYVPLGITLTAEQFIDLPRLRPEFEQRLRAWGLRSPGEAIGGAITIRDPAQIVEIMRARPGSDFYVPSGWIHASTSTHRLFQYSASRVFLLSTQVGQINQQVEPIPVPW